MSERLFLCLPFCLLFTAACESNGVGRKGESCTMRSDCQKGLACFANVCTLDDFQIADRASGCDYVECRSPADCVSTRANCVLLQNDCDAGDQLACTSFDNQCSFRCDEQRCLPVQCDADADCFGGNVCVTNLCVQCVNDSSCGDDEVCNNNSCVAACVTNFDCPLFDDCVAGRCEDGICETDRECVALFNNVEAVCGAEGACTQPCVTDTDCDQSFNFDFIACVSGECAYVGCETDDECRAIAYGGGAVPDTVLAIACVENPVNPNPPFGAINPGCNEYLCATGECIPFTFICDGFPDCGSGEDEGVTCP